jgi:hypothetical protein
MMMMMIYIISDNRVCHGEKPANVSLIPIQIINSGSFIFDKSWSERERENI